MLVVGDLFDSAYPPIEILKRTFAEFRKLKEAGIKSFIIAGSHDYSVSGKTFLDVLEKGGFVEMCKYKETEEAIYLEPCKYPGFEIFGYPGKKSGMEVEGVRKIVLPKETNDFRILMLHTSITEAVGNLPIESVPMNSLPRADYYALGHLHINFEEKIKDKPIIYSGPIFPNSFQELEDLAYGRFYIVRVEGFVDYKKIEIMLKEVIAINIEIENTITGTQKILKELDKHDLTDKIVLLRLYGAITQGTHADINYEKIRTYLQEKGIYSLLRNTTKLVTKEEEIELKIQAGDMNKVEESLIEEYKKNNPDKFNNFILPLLTSLDLQKQEDEKSVIYEARLLADLNKILNLELK